MTSRIDRAILIRLLLITSMVLFLLILIFIVIDYSENSDDFSDRGAPLGMVWTDYYLPYIPEIIRLVTPVAVFTASLLIMGLMTQRREWIALKAGGVSLYRIQRPFLIFGLAVASLVFVLDGFVIPPATAKRLLFERDYVMTRSDRVENSTIYRQESPDHLLTINYYSPVDSMAFRVFSYRFKDDRMSESMEIQQMVYQSSSGQWRLFNVKQNLFDSVRVTRNLFDTLDVNWSVYPRDMARTTTEIYQLSYPDAWQYIESLKRVGVGGLELPQVQFFGRLAYPLSILIVTLLGVAISSIRFNGGTGMHLGIGLAVSFLYLAMMKLIEPFGYSGLLSPAVTTLFPHLFFLTVTLIVVWRTPK
jgi:lipopolysaccharide export system permease protein